MTAVFFALKVEGTILSDTPIERNNELRLAMRLYDDNMILLQVVMWVCKLTEGLGEESDTLVGHGVVGPLPVENLGEEARGYEGLHDHHDLEVGHFSDVLMAGQVAILADDDDSLLQ